MANNVTLAQGNEVVRLANDKGLTVEKFQADLLDSGIVADVIEASKQGTLPERNALRKVLGLAPIYPDPTITKLGCHVIDYDEDIADLLKRGKYDWKNGNVNAKNFPPRLKGRVKSDLVLVHFGRDMSDEQVLTELAKLDLEPADAYEDLTVGAEKPELQREFPIPAIGQHWQDRHGSRCVVFVCRHADERCASLDYLGGEWDGDCRFLARRKQK
ncbi:MAG: hypothetical protein CEN90_406 [Parcubacteria group bacterium Licking1014_17]|nr:MAG: hypothetical protein CEN90_406 [Parcubacteria group bacterium Licking1014_17]